MKLGICRLCEQEKKLIKAHIMPDEYTPDNARVYSADFIYGKKKRPGGLYDDGILCKECDGGILGALDKLSYKFFLTPATKMPNENAFIKKVNYEKNELHKFIYSVMWRASISSRPDVKHAKLGDEHETQLKRLFLSPTEIDIYEYPIIMSYLTNFPANDKIIGMPYFQKYRDGVSYVDIIFDRYIVSIKVDNKTNRLYKNGENRILGESDQLLILNADFNTSKYLRGSMASSLKKAFPANLSR